MSPPRHSSASSYHHTYDRSQSYSHRVDPMDVLRELRNTDPATASRVEDLLQNPKAYSDFMQNPNMVIHSVMNRPRY